MKIALYWQQERKRNDPWRCWRKSAHAQGPGLNEGPTFLLKLRIALCWCHFHRCSRRHSEQGMPRLLAIAVLLSIDAVHAHGHLTQPRPRPPVWARDSMEGLTSASSEYRMDEPTHSLLNGPVT